MGLVRWTRREAPPHAVPARRPVECVARDLARLGPRFHAEGLRFTKYEALRLAYDQVLAEACDVLELAHLLSVLPPGPERDAERERVEGALRGTGLVAPA